MKKILILLISAVLLVSGFGIVSSYVSSKDNSIAESNIEIKGVKIPVLIYHHVVDKLPSSSDETVVSTGKFTEDILTLKKAGYEAIFLNDILDYVEGRTALPKKPIVITFDDGYFSNYDKVFPIMKEQNYKMTIFSIGWSVGEFRLPDTPSEITPHFSWSEASEMYKSGLIDIQNHSFDLHSLPGTSLYHQSECGFGILPLEDLSYEKYYNYLNKDFSEMDMLFYTHLDYLPTFFAYPFGHNSSTSESIIIEDLGYDGTLTVEEGVRVFKSKKDLKLIPRINVSESDSGDKLIKKIENAKNK